ncbi:hypothetical protein cypCar_00018234 [Cyprinus carpio]|nr:hypothetical protein cypCar_00018234 [Cyprinus carpio]
MERIVLKLIPTISFFFVVIIALADILRQQGPIPVSQYEHENIAAIDTSPKENTPVRTSKNHYTPVHNKNNHAQHSVDDLGQLSWQGDLDVPLSYIRQIELGTVIGALLRVVCSRRFMLCPVKVFDSWGRVQSPKALLNGVQDKDPFRNSVVVRSIKHNFTDNHPHDYTSHLDLTGSHTPKIGDKDDEYYIRKHHLPDQTHRGNLQTHMIKLNVDPPAQRQKPKRVQRAMSQDHDPLLSPDKMLSLRRSNFREKAMSRALSHTDMFVPTTPVMDRHYKMMKMHSHPSSSNESYNTLTVESAQVGNKRQAFANRRMHTVDHLQYIPGHHHHQYRTASKTEVTV